MTLPVQTDMIAATVISSALCAMISPFLLLGRNSYMAGVSCPAALPGIAFASLFAKSMSSPFVVIMGCLSTFIGTAAVGYTARDSSISRLSLGVTAGALFLAAGIIIAGLPGGISINSLILGETSLSPFDRASLLYFDMGPSGLYSLSIAIVLIGGSILLFYKDLKLELFDAGYASSIHIGNNRIAFLLPALTAIAVGSSAQTSGIFMTPAFLLLPAAAAYFYTKRLSAMIIISVIIAVASALTGYGIAYNLKYSPSGSVICVMGIIFIISMLFAPETGIIYKLSASRKEKEAFEENIILRDLLNIKEKENIFDYHNESVLNERLNIKKEKFRLTINKLKAEGLVHIENDELFITDEGKKICGKNKYNIA